MQNEPISQEPMPQIQAASELPALPAPPEKAQREVAPPSGVRWQRSLGCLLRVGLSALVIVVLVAAVYFGWPVVYASVYARYILPVQDNTTRIAAVEIHQQAGQDQLSVAQTQIPAMATAQVAQEATLSARIAALESANKAGDQALATIQAGQAAALAALVPLQGTQAVLQSTQAALQSMQGALQSTQAALESTLKEQSSALQARDVRQRAELDRQITLLKSMELLSRARLFLYESNFGLVKKDIQAARDLLAALPDPSGYPDLAEVNQHLNQALARLPDFPVAASDNLDMAWQILLGVQLQLATPAPSETPGVTPTPTP